MKLKNINENLKAWRDAKPEELQQKLVEMHKDLQSFYLQKATGQLGQQHLVAVTKREIARIKTIIGQQSQVQ